MQPDNFNAIGMILLLLGTLVVIAIAGKRPQGISLWLKRLFAAAFFGFIAYILTPAMFICVMSKDLGLIKPCLRDYVYC
jgi:hypothetical protein